MLQTLNYVSQDALYAVSSAYIMLNADFEQTGAFVKVRIFDGTSFSGQQEYEVPIDEHGYLKIGGNYYYQLMLVEVPQSLEPYWKYSDEDFWDWQPCHLYYVDPSVNEEQFISDMFEHSLKDDPF